MDIYFDSAATSIKPHRVLEAQKSYSTDIIQNINRGTGIKNFQASSLIENIRQEVAGFIGCENKDEIIFTGNSTESINLVANSFIKPIDSPGKNIVVTALEHHSNYVPWMELCKSRGLEFRVANLKNYRLDYDDLFNKIDSNTLLVSITGMSNLTGELTDLVKIIKFAKGMGSYTLIDGAQLVVHKEIDINSLGADFLVFSAHKLYGPFGLGVLYARNELLKKFKPINFGGNMVSYIGKDGSVHYKDTPHLLEPGTRNPGAIYAFKESLDYVKENHIEKMNKKSDKLGSYLTSKLNDMGGITIYSVPGSIVSFNIDGVHPHDASEFFDRAGIILRVGNLCASPFFINLQESGVIRASFCYLNTKEEVDKLIETINEIKEFFL